MTAVGAGAAGVVESETEVWCDGNDRCRIDRRSSDGDGWVRVEDGATVVTYSFDYGAIAKMEPRELRGPSIPELWWRPRALMSAVEITSVTEASLFDRLCWRVEARRDLARTRAMRLLLPGDRFVMWVDEDTGIVLRCVETTNGDSLSSTAWTAFWPLGEIGDAVFDQGIPADVEVRSLADVALQRARHAGVDVSGVDTTDVAAIYEAIGDRGRPGPLDLYLPTGDPPDDIAQSETDIRAAYAGISKEDGDSLPNVEAGDELASVARQYLRRSPHAGSEISVQEIRFLSATRAIVLFPISARHDSPVPGSMTGRAVRVDGRWRVARSTFSRLMRLAGIEPPPVI